MEKIVTYRKVELSDSVKLSVLLQLVFIQTYDVEGVTQESANYVTKEFSLEKIENKIKAAPDNFIVAMNDDNLVGVAEILFDQKCPVNNIVIPELSKLYVLERFSGIGIGHRLLTEAEKIINSKDLKEIWLSVYELNARAISFYERQNYESIGEMFFQMEFNSYRNIVMLKKL